MNLPKAFPENSAFKNLKKFQASPVAYMEENVRSFGSPVDLNLPIGEFVVTADPEQVHQVLAVNHEKYGKSKGYKEIARVLGNGLLTAEGEDWQRQRKALQPLFHKNELRSLVPAVWEAGLDYISGWENKFVLHTDAEMSRLTLTLLLSSLVRQQDEDIKQAMSANILFGQQFISSRIRSFVKAPVWFPTSSNIGYHKMMKEIKTHVRRFVEERKKVDEKNIKDLLDVLIKNNQGEDGFKVIRDELITFMVAGHETSSLGLTWTLKLLAENTEVQERVYEEVKNIEDINDIDLLNFENLQYLQNVLKESMRLYPPIWNIVRRAKEQDNIAGYDIKKGKQIMCVIYLIHRNEKYWPEAEKFIPERFERDNMKNWHKYQYIPFGGGPRFCIGNNFALYEMMVMLVLFVKNFRFSRENDGPIGFNPLLTLRPGREVLLKVERRQALLVPLFTLAR